MNTKTTDFKSIFLKLASPEDILSWSFGEVTKGETINYRTQRPERDGLFDERIFGPEKDYECYCGKYRRVRYKGVICEKCGVEVTRSIVRRERMGHIALAAPVAHIWFLRGIPSRIGLMLDISVSELEKVIYFAGYIITKVNEEAKKEVFEAIEKEFKIKSKKIATPEEKKKLKDALSAAKKEIESIAPLRVIDELDYRRLSLKYGELFEAGSGAETFYSVCKNLNLEDLAKKYELAYENATPQNKKKVARQVGFINSMIASKIRPEWMFMTVLPVIPPALRPMVQLDGGRHATSDVNDLYRRVLNRNNRLKRLLEINAPDVIVKNEKRMLQEAVDSLIDNSIRRGQQTAALSQAQKRPLRSLSDMLRGKQGRFRQNLLGKRVDYSGRSVIVVGPNLKMDQCGMPKQMALELFRPFVISQLIKRELAYNIRGANRLIDEKTDEVWEILENVIKDKYVLLNRAPTLHRLGIQAFKPILIDGEAIQIHPLVCSAFNADFDGDQMAVHVPLSEEAQEEAREIMASTKNLLIPRTGDPVVNPSQDIVLGCFFMTRIRKGAKGEGKYFSSPNEAILAYDFGEVELQALVKVLPTSTKKYEIFKGEMIDTTVGRLLFNSFLPSELSFINDEFGKKRLAKIVDEIIRFYGVDATPPILDKIKEFGYTYSTKSGISWGMDDVKEPEKKHEIIEEAEIKHQEIYEHFNNGLLTEDERYIKSIGIWQEAKNKVDDLVPSGLDQFGPVYSMVSSAARGSWGQINQMAGMKGLVANPSGKIIDFPIISSYKKGLNVLEYFISTHGARKGTADTALKTAKAGYLTRRLVDVAQDVIITEEDCGDKKGLTIKRDIATDGSFEEEIASRIKGRILLKDISIEDKEGKGKKIFKAGDMLSSRDAEQIDKAGVSEVRVRSPLSCETQWGICRKCYGLDLGRNELIKIGEAAGIIAAQAVGEPGTQLTMRTFHEGGVAKKGGDITLGLPRVEELFEARTPSNPAVITEYSGDVLEIKEADSSSGEKTVVVLPEASEIKAKKAKSEKPEKTEVEEYVIPFGKRIIVKKGAKVKAGDPLTDGPIDIKVLFKIAGKEAAENYILKQVGKVYDIQGVSIHDKHLEIIVRQMFSRYKVKSSGDTPLNKGQLVERTILLEENKKAREKGGEEAGASITLMGVSKVSLSTSSFLSAASFQDTARVLIKTSTEGGRDKLRGLKENVIIGHLIPAGTGIRKDLKCLERFNNMPPAESREEEY
ncbi:MAG: DNA-directed RNA polymerase subunit beta' [Candidatus Pacebacteria bacterium]|nr:DNA-directed RNA polymerase subunit beta' [Candidatus Paceibacterota bacterium]